MTIQGTGASGAAAPFAAAPASGSAGAEGAEWERAEKNLEGFRRRGDDQGLSLAAGPGEAAP
jgi:hypothetical protein